MRQGGATDGRNRNPKVSRLVPSRLNLSGDEMRAGRLLMRSRCLGSIALVSVSGPVSARPISTLLQKPNHVVESGQPVESLSSPPNALTRQIHGIRLGETGRMFSACTFSGF